MRAKVLIVEVELGLNLFARDAHCAGVYAKWKVVVAWRLILGKGKLIFYNLNYTTDKAVSDIL